MISLIHGVTTMKLTLNAKDLQAQIYQLTEQKINQQKYLLYLSYDNFIGIDSWQ